MSYLHKVRIVTEEAMTHIYLDDHEVKGCVSASVDYGVDRVPSVRLELQALDIEEEIDEVPVEIAKVGDDDIEKLKLSKRTYLVLKRAGVDRISALVGLYNTGAIWRIPNLGMKTHEEIKKVLKDRGLI